MIDNNSKEFIYRHIGPTEDEQEKMLGAIGYKSLEDLMKNTVPEKILLKDELKIDAPLSENDALKKLKSISKKIRYLEILLEWAITTHLHQMLY